jgi:RND family efflux transporter MFP subunit
MISRHLRRLPFPCFLAGRPRLPLVLVLVAGMLGCEWASRPPDETKAGKGMRAELPVIRAQVLTVQSVLWPTIVRTQGSLIADEVTVVGAKVAGRVEEVHVDLGDAVRQGQPLARLDQADFHLQVLLAEAQLAQARAALGLKETDPVEGLDPHNAPPVREAKAVWEEARTRLARLRQLQTLARNTVTQEEIDQAEAAEAAAAARHAAAINAVRERIAQVAVQASTLAVARQHLADTVVVAPFDALVQERHVAPGTFVQVGSPLVTLARTSRLRFRGTIPERHAHRLALGQEVTLRIEGLAQPRQAAVTRISPALDELTRSLTFEAVLDNADGSLRSGLFAEADVVVDSQATALVVPRSAVVRFAGAEKVWKVVAGQAQEQLIQTGRQDGQWLEVLAGLSRGDQVLADGSQGRLARVEPLAEQGGSAPLTGQPESEAELSPSGEEGG